MKRLAALGAAVAMVIVAIAIRNEFDDDANPVATGSGDVVCPEEFRDLCADVVDSRSERAGTTADALIAADDTSGFDGAAWVVPAAWARLVIDERARLGRSPLFEIDGEPLASTAVVKLLWEGQAEEFTEACGATTWRCIADAPAVSFRVRPGMPDVEGAFGLSVAAAQAADLLGRSDYTSNDFDLDGDFRRRATFLAQDQLADPIREMRAKGPGRLSVVGTVAARAASLSASQGTIVRAPSEPTIRVDVVALVPTNSSLDGDARRRLRQALIDAGWDDPPAIPDGLPSGSVLAAVRTLWNENR